MIESTQQSLLQFHHSPAANYVGTVLILAVVYLVRTRYHHGLNKIPGPFIASLTSLWKWDVVRREKMPFVNTELHEKHGPLVRIGPNHISASSVESIQVVHRARSGFTKSGIYGILQPRFEGSDLHNVFSTQDAEYHAALKRTMGTLYTTTAVSSLEFHLDDCTKLFISKMNGIIGSGESAPVDLAAWLQYYAFDSLGAVNFSQKLGFLDSGTDVDGICHLDHEQMMYFAVWGQITTTERAWSKVKALLTGARKENPLFNFALKLVQDRQANPTESTDMLNLFLSLHKAVPEKFTIRDVIAAAYINVVTAHDVVAITLRAVVYYLAKNPAMQEKLQKEISDAIKEGNLSNPAKYSEITSLRYVLAVTNETLRIHPSTGLILERRCPKDGVTLHGKHIPEGTIIGVNCWVVNRDKGIFGEDADSFRPERWIDSDPKDVARMRVNMFTFGAGARNCIGKNLAMMQLTKIIVELYRNFDIKLANPDKEWTVSGGWLTRQTDMETVLTKRS
ncbi:cytochrome P450 [Jackrogersella minutella]|nr:cytochrome P450 [Jackrogersella minutella]